MTDERSQDLWVDQRMSADLPVLRAKGESQNLEFMRSFPDQAHDLGKEVAAFATSNSGTILIGVDNKGDLIGLPEADTVDGRDMLLRRVEGVCQGRVKPSITPSVTFARETGHVVLVLTVPKGSQPVYYSNNVPYVRHITSSRPAEPHEVIDLIRASLALGIRATDSIEEERPSPRVQFLLAMMRVLLRVRLFGEELDERMVNPWLEQVRAQFADVAAELRDAAADSPASKGDVQPKLLDVATALDQVAGLTLHLGSGPELEGLVRVALVKAESLLRQVQPEISAHVSSEQLREELGRVSRQLTILGEQSGDVKESGDIKAFQSKAAEIGGAIFFISHYGVNRLGEGLEERLRAVGHRLHVAETRRVYLDGGVSVRRIIAEIEEAIVEYRMAVAPILHLGAERD